MDGCIAVYQDTYDVLPEYYQPHLKQGAYSHHSRVRNIGKYLDQAHSSLRG